MSDRLAVELNIPRLVSRSGRLQGYVPFAHFKRLQGYLLEPVSGDLYVDLKFGGVELHVNGTAHCRLSGEVRVECHRCSGETTHQFDDEVEFAFIKQEAEADEVDDRFEPVLMDENGRIRTVDMLEDELILQLPIAPRHADGEPCIEQVPGVLQESAVAEKIDEQQRENPFAALKSLNLN